MVYRYAPVRGDGRDLWRGFIIAMGVPPVGFMSWVVIGLPRRDDANGA
jgi:hypothetical protein